MGKASKAAPPPTPAPAGPMITCAGCKKQIPLSQYLAIRRRLYVFGPDGNGVFEALPFCSKDCWDEHPTPTKRAVRALMSRCHDGARTGDQCTAYGAYTCQFACCSCRKCADHRTDGMVLVAKQLSEVLNRVG